jgi:glycogen synthase
MHALVTADTIGGVWTYARELVTGLVRRGVRVTLVSFGDIPTPEQTEWMQTLTGFSYRPTAFRLEWMQDADSDIQASSEYLRALISEVRPDILHLNQRTFPKSSWRIVTWSAGGSRSMVRNQKIRRGCAGIEPR